MLNIAFNLFYAFIILLFISYSIIKVGSELCADLRKPYLGFASTYLFNYFISCILILLQCFFAIIYVVLKKPLDVQSIIFVYCSHTYAIYQGAIFLIKKYNFTKIKNELIITSVLQFLCYLNICFACCCPIFREIYTPALTFTSYPELLFYLLAGLGNYVIFQESNNIIYSILVLLKFIPLIILGTMWIKSIGKSYYKKSHSYFVKSANHPVFFFLFYEFILISLSYFNFHSTYEITILITIILFLKSIFSSKVLFWLRNKDMEEIETNAILRSQNGVSNNI